MIIYKKYHHELVIHLAKSSYLGVLSSSVIGIMIASYIIYDKVPLSYLISVIIASSMVAMIRVYTTRTFLNIGDDSYDMKYVNFSIHILFFTALIYGSIIYMAIRYHVDTSDIFLLALLIIALVAGSVSTLGAIFSIFIVFAGSSLLFLILNFLFLDTKSLPVLILILVLFSLFFIISGYKNYQFLTNYMLLQEKQLETQKKLKKFNDTLELTIQKEVEKNREKDQQLLNQSRLAQMGEMIGSIAHQWRQPLNEISTGIQNLKYDYKEELLQDEKYIKEFIDKNKKTIAFMSQTIDDFRNFFRVEKEQKEFPLLSTTQSVINMQSAQLKNYQITVELSGKELLYIGFQREYQQVILNLMNNAKDALLENLIVNPKITIHIKDMCVIFSDNAGGIPLTVINRIFEPYFTTKEQGKGTGIGLYMSKMIIEDNMGGNLSVSNDTDGAVFKIDFSIPLKA